MTGSGVIQAADTGTLYAGGLVGGQWQSAYASDLASTRGWHAGEWHHVAYAFSAAGNFMRLYIDGKLVADTNEGFYHPPAADSSLFWLGGLPDGTPALYDLDEVHLWRRALSAAEIRARAARFDQPLAHESWLDLSGIAPGSVLVFEVTAPGGAPCTSNALTYPGLPVSGADPPSTLLPAGITGLALTITTTQPTDCRWSLGEPLAYADMVPFESGAGSTVHRTTVGGLDPDPNRVNEVYVRCASHPDYVHHLRYRVLSHVTPRFPRTGNLWGAWEYFANGGLPHCARIDLWLGAGFAPDHIRTLRGLNPEVRVLTSINAVERGGLPDGYYLKDVNGQKIEVWPGSYRLNLTKTEVAEAQAQFAAQRILDSDLMVDGCFFDNVFLSQSWLTSDIHGNPVHIDADEDGVEDDPAALDAAWKAGVLHELETFRQLMPWALVSGHAQDISEPGIASLFNGISVGFHTADVIEDERSFLELWDELTAWDTLAAPPHITMTESSPIDQFAYGYDYTPGDKIPPETLQFAAGYGPWVRFGLAVTLMTDGYFAHEFGDTWHGNDWWYDELDFDLGYPLGPAQLVDLGTPPPPELLADGSFEDPQGTQWSFWVSTGEGAAATVARDTSTAADGTASARVEVTSATGTDWHVELGQDPLPVVQGRTYELAFWAKADQERPITVSLQQNGPPWQGYGLWREVPVGTAWSRHVVHFRARATGSDGRLGFLFGAAAGTVWVDGVSLRTVPSQVWKRDFTHGTAIVNGTHQEVTVPVEAGFSRLTGTQSPRWEPIVDDADPGFSTTGAWSTAQLDSGEWQDAGPFFHDWGEACRLSSGSGATATWPLPVAGADGWTISVWWPAAPQSSGWSHAAAYQVVAGGQVVATATLDQSAGGDRWIEVAHVALAPDESPVLRLVCPDGEACCADAVLLRSDRRYNDGTVVTGSVTLGPTDGIVLRWASPAGPGDVNRDAVVDGADMLEILRAIYGAFTPLDVDTNDDDSVDAADLALVVQAPGP